MSINLIEIYSIAAAKLANATRTHKSTTMTNSLSNYHYRQSLTSSIMHPTSSSLKCLASNGSGIENFSTDDVEEVLCPKTECLKPLSTSNSMHNNITTNNHSIQCQRSDISTSQISLIINVDETRTLPTSKKN
jgi:hypothetical protein